MSLELACKYLGWPEPGLVINPSGEGLRALNTLARKKIGDRLAQDFPETRGCRIAILANDFNAPGTPVPLAIVCVFARAVPQRALAALHRLAWNFSHAPTLVVAEAQRLRVFTCCKPPPSGNQLLEEWENLPSEIPDEAVDFGTALQGTAAKALHWVNLASGILSVRYPQLFDRNQCADRMLLENLKVVRDRLHSGSAERSALALDIIHDLLARLIFVQFLFQRMDSHGQAALNREFMVGLHEQGHLRCRHEDLESVLRDHADTYALFRYLDQRFNGDLFPGKDKPAMQRRDLWADEMAVVQQTHLDLMAEFIAGRMRVSSGQYALWPLYSFDTIPLEFVSSIYEAFVTKQKGTVYTPVQLVDFLLDGVLPWTGDEWNLTILDPACGSGVFLVRAFQRLVYRWRTANPGSEPTGRFLSRFLEQNFYGVDIDPAAIRVASFSLYLALCDEIDPRRYWTEIRLPCLRDQRLISGDFFDDRLPGLNTSLDAGRYDLVIGNPPWGKRTVAPKDAHNQLRAPRRWAKEHGWPLSYHDIGSLFIAKAGQLTKAEGCFSLIQPAGALLWNRSGPASQIRRRLLETFAVREIVNLSAVRFGLFIKALGPCAIITGFPTLPRQDATISYVVVKPVNELGDEYGFEVGPYDSHEVPLHEATNDPLVWITLTWGDQRDRVLLRKLTNFGNPHDLVERGGLRKRRGLIRGRGGRQKEQPILNRPILESKKIPSSRLLTLDSATLPTNIDPYTASSDSTDWRAFEQPQALVKMGWTKETGRFRGVRVRGEAALCNDSYISLGGSDADPNLVDSAVLSFNSKFATAFLLLTSGRFANYRPAPSMDDLMQVPCPAPRPGLLEGLDTLDQVDQRTYEAFGFCNSERALIEDLFHYTIPFFKGNGTAVPRLPTRRGEQSELVVYAQWLIDVMHASFGTRRECSATIFNDVGEQLPVRLVALHLEAISGEMEGVRMRSLDDAELVGTLLGLQTLLTQQEAGSGFVYRRILRVYDKIEWAGRSVPTVFIAKPDEARFWTRTMAMRDADSIVADILSAGFAGVSS
ncbi:HsdM family class I SAM-dependent methyltransferase [Candidatus Thiodictyon syntrophicum]|jgi:hypothetical protein|uniref:site-specific DNA-methyltransferase (adenine-specific) n=1 Tax=Candidatus Thiodictyon syntrophicum TaxID=1166950 RepID=A0A2K8U6A0_9GAMM|nr:N-6 DNA methylase [Candidatus Thiodictyon syntrophicum]AUB81112.1 hypothetical protein THSYN_09195 [Candidatus Thiodictyon syntrophicum]